jgi:hypothetical protein
MLQKDIHNFLERYFVANDCELLDRHEKMLHVQLTIELDKLLMNRPFYWHYQQLTGAEPNPMKLMLQTEQSEDGITEGEFIHFGSPRLHQIFHSTKQLGSYIRLFENVLQNNQSYIPLVPWLGLNVKVSYQCDRKKDFLHSIGLNLINGMMVGEFQSMLEAKSLTPKIPDYCYTMSSMIKPVSGIKRIEAYIEQTIQADDPEWSIEARKRWQEDEELLDHFYQDEEVLPEAYHVEKQALKELYEPKVIVQMINGGMFYLSNDTMGH